MIAIGALPPGFEPNDSLEINQQACRLLQTLLRLPVVFHKRPQPWLQFYVRPEYHYPMVMAVWASTVSPIESVTIRVMLYVPVPKRCDGFCKVLLSVSPNCQ